MDARSGPRTDRWDARAWALALAACLLALLAAGCRERGAPATATPERTPPADLPAVRRFEVTPGRTIAYWGNADLAAARGRSRAVIVVHGDARNADEYFAFARTAADLARSDALIIAPRFVTEDDEGRAPSDLIWTDATWKDGATPVLRDAVSSFGVMDRLLAALAEETSLRDIVIVGHSAGGQFVQRYAAAARLPDGPHVRFVVANPSSYVYLDDRRPDAGRFDEPSRSTERGCSRYDRYKYGLERLPEPLDAIGADTLRTQYRARDVTILLGALDRSDEDNLDRGCEARLQGAQRYERGVLFYQYVQALFPPVGDHRLRIVPGVGHDAAAMLRSEAALDAVFDASAR
ncbi:MAG: alpha/beta hydrolase [Dehalococcoidia bacterium]